MYYSLQPVLIILEINNTGATGSSTCEEFFHQVYDIHHFLFSLTPSFFSDRCRNAVAIYAATHIAIKFTIYMRFRFVLPAPLIFIIVLEYFLQADIPFIARCKSSDHHRPLENRVTQHREVAFGRKPKFSKTISA